MNQQPDARSTRPSGVVLVLAVVGALALITALAFLALAIFAMKSIPSSTRMGHGEGALPDTVDWIASVGRNQT